MTKHQEYNIAFYTTQGPLGFNHIFDTRNALPQYQLLFFINSLSESEIVCLLEDINRIIKGEVYDPDFLSSSEIYEVFNVQFKNPHFLVDGYEAITMHDLKPLLEEWLDYLNEQRIIHERKADLPGKFIAKFSLLTKTIIAIFAPSNTKTL